MIIQYHDGYMNLEDIRELIHTDNNGTRAYDLIEGAKSIGFCAKGVFCPSEKLLEEELVLPCIANVIINQSYSHFIVIYTINKKKEEILIADPANKIRKMKLDSFQSIYSGNLFILYPERPLLQFCKKQGFSWKNVYILLKESKIYLWQTFILSVVILIYAIATSFYGEVMFKNLQSNQKESYLLLLFIVFTILTFLKLTSEFFRTRLFLWIQKKIEIVLTRDTFLKVLFLPYHYYHNHTTGDILSRIQSVEDIKIAISKWILVIMVDIPLMFLSFICLYFLHSKLAMCVLLFFLLQLVILKIFEKPLEENIENCQNENAILSTLEVESIRSFETMKGISLESYFYDKLMKEKVLFLRKFHDLESLLSLENYGKELCQSMSSLILLFWGCIFVRRGELNFATLLTIQNLTTYFYTPLRELIDLDKDTKQAKTAYERISVFERERPKRYLEKLEVQNIHFQNVSYSYKPDKEILHHISLKIDKGEKILVLGHSGSGKSTLFKLLKRYYEVPRGMIQINGNDINDYDNTEKICYIHQNENLYTESLLENIQLGRNVETEYFNKILHICSVDEIVDKDHLGYYKLIEENGINLSGGERQRIILARTLLGPFEVLIIDEGLNQVDVNLERKILKGIFRKFRDKTIIIISHREENVDLFDRKLRMKNGMIVEDIQKNDK